MKTAVFQATRSGTRALTLAELVTFIIGVLEQYESDT